MTVEGANGGSSAARRIQIESGGSGDHHQPPGPTVFDEDDGAVGGLGVSLVWGPDQQDSTAQLTDLYRDDAATGQHLYLDFIRSEMVRNGLESELPCLERDEVAELETYGSMAQHMMWTRAGRELRQLADAFSDSHERQTVRKRAESLQLQSLDAERFFHLLQELFLTMILIPFILAFYNMLVVLAGEGITRERVLVLFFFCADVAIGALRRGFHAAFHDLLRWSLKYIATRVASYVHSVGGWGVVLRESLDIAYQVTACCAFVAVVVACVVYIRRNLS